MRSRAGLALTLVVGVLAVLAVLGSAFAVLSRLERRAAAQRANATRAFLLARSGIEDGMARIERGEDPDAGTNRYLGEDWDGSGTLNGFEASPQADTYQPGTLNVENCPIRNALRPSFFVRSRVDVGADWNPAPERIPVDGRMRGSSGVFPLRDLRHTYAIKVMPQAGLNVNGGDPAQGADFMGNAYFNDRLRKILEDLAAAIGGPVTAADGTNLIAKRPRTSRGWEDWAQIRDVALGKSQAKLDALRPYLSLHTWSDKRVVHPNSGTIPAGTLLSYDSTARLQLGRPVPGGISESASPWTQNLGPDFERIPGLYDIRNTRTKIVGRSPVNLAWARRRKPVLVALMTGLKGTYLDETWLGSPTGPGGSVPAVYFDFIGTANMATLSAAEVDWIADRIVASDVPFDSWKDWDAFCDSLVPPGFTGTSDHVLQAKRDLLKANFNPNTDLNKLNPNASLWRSVDKSDLVGLPYWNLGYSTEFSLIPVHGHEVVSMGRVSGADGRILAERTLTATVGGPSVARLSTQKEFVCGDLGNLDVPGDESGIRFPLDCVSANASSGAWTWGARQGQGSQGVSLQTYPEPYTNGGSGLAIDAADYDGSVQSATVETRADAPRLRMLAAFDADADLDEGSGIRTYLEDAWLQHAALPLSVWHKRVPNPLRPDGLFSQKFCTPGYHSRGNADGFHGVISTWVKARSAHPMWRGYRILQGTNFKDASRLPDSLSQFFYLGFACSTPERPLKRFHFMFETGHLPDSSVGAAREHGWQTPVRGSDPHRWHLVTAMYDFLSPLASDCGRLIVDDGNGDLDSGSLGYRLSGFTLNDWAGASDLTLPDTQGAHRFYLGHRSWIGECEVNQKEGSSSEITLDEFAIYDFGGASGGAPAPADALAGPATLALNRFREGRYYKESAYPEMGGLTTPRGFPLRTAAEYLSAPIALGPARIRALSWTQVVPPELPQGAISFELADAAGTDYLKDVSGSPVSGRFRNPLLSLVGKRVNAPFRLHAVFQPNLADPDNTPILEPLVLDDVTVLYSPSGGPRMLAWGDTSTSP